LMLSAVNVQTVYDQVRLSLMMISVEGSAGLTLSLGKHQERRHEEDCLSPSPRNNDQGPTPHSICPTAADKPRNRYHGKRTQ
jgi:hypothetical protein